MGIGTGERRGQGQLAIFIEKNRGVFQGRVYCRLHRGDKKEKIGGQNLEVLQISSRIFDFIDADRSNKKVKLF